jgi:hypothetical protein
MFQVDWVVALAGATGFQESLDRAQYPLVVISLVVVAFPCRNEG